MNFIMLFLSIMFSLKENIDLSFNFLRVNWKTVVLIVLLSIVAPVQSMSFTFIENQLTRVILLIPYSIVLSIISIGIFYSSSKYKPYSTIQSVSSAISSQDSSISKDNIGQNSQETAGWDY